MSENDVQTDVLERDCAVCLQKCSYPTQLPCGHIFCFLCVKGVAIQSRRCALCRDAIPADYLEHPVFLEKLQPSAHTSDNTEYHWYYEGRNGWWKYDERSNAELENVYSSGESSCKLLLAGAVYNVDFTTMLQVRSRDPTRRRRVRRDTNALPAKGIAGIKIEDSRIANEIKNDDDQEANTNSEQRETVPTGDNVLDNHHGAGPAPILNIDNENEILEISAQYNPLNEIVQRISTIDLTSNEEEIHLVSDDDSSNSHPEDNTTDT